MLKWALIFFIVSVVAGLLGFAGVAGVTAGIAKFLFSLFLALFVFVLLFGKMIVS